MEKGKSIPHYVSEVRKYIGIPIVVRRINLPLYGKEYIIDKINEVHRKNVRLENLGWQYLGDDVSIYEAIGHELPTKNIEFKVKYRKGYPTKKSLYELERLFNETLESGKISLYVSTYSKEMDRYLISCTRTNDRIHEFIDWATENYDISFGELREYKRPMVGCLMINKK